MSQLIAGVDEAGRGALAGPVTAAAVILAQDRLIPGLADSKKLSSTQREYLAIEIRAQAIAWSIGWSDIGEISEFNILQAALLAMKRSIACLHINPDKVLVDGNRSPMGLRCPVEAIIGGDRVVPSISAASILAKVARDREMRRLHQLYPQYGLAKHKGYATKSHIETLKRFGPSSCHRMTFSPVRAVQRAWYG